MAAYNLPPVTKEFPEPKSHGDWSAITNLSALARSLRLDKAPVRSDELKSIPDVWAQAQLTTDAFFDQDHDAHDDVVAQWRGLLATFALQPLYAAEYDLAINTLDLTDRATASKFKQVLQRLLPKQSASLGLSWEKLGIVEFLDRGSRTVGGSALAFLSPSMLIAPGRMASKFSMPTVPWLAGGLHDPLQSSGLKPEAFAILAEYIKGLIETISSHRSPDVKVEKRDELLRQLRAFSDGCEQRQRRALPTKSVELRLAWPDPFFKVLGRTQSVDKANIAPSDSDCLLNVRPGRSASLYQGIILVDPSIADTLNKPSSDVRVWKQYTLRDAEAAASFSEMKADAHASGYLILRKEDLFTYRLVRLDEGAEVPGNPVTLRQELLPLSPIALLLNGWADDAELAEKGGEAHFSIQVELTQSGVRHRVARTFAANEVLTFPPPADLAVWPNFQADDWPWTFLRFQYDPRSDLITRFAASASFVASCIESDDPQVKLRNVEHWASSQDLTVDRTLNAKSISAVEDAQGRKQLERFRFRDEAQLIGEQHRLPHGAEAIFFAVRDAASSRDLPAGCVVMRLDAAPQSIDKSVVAFDFGTTNTVAYSKRGNQPAKRIAFKDRIVQPIKTGGGKDEVAAAYTDFFPVNDHDTPVPTIAKKREFGGGALPRDIRQALNDKSDIFGLSHMVFFQPRGGIADTPEFMLRLINAGILEFDIKWGERAEDRQLVQSFLKQLMIMVAAELRADGISISNIQWRYSFPQAFNTDHKHAFQGIIRNAWSALAQDNEAIGPVAHSISFSTEADAAMRYFTLDQQQQKFGVGRLVVMFDIGGGTSDIAIWKDKTLLWRGSARLAGSHFFSAYLRENLGILEAIDKDAVRAFRAGGTAHSVADESFRARQLVELLVARKDFSAKFDAAYPLHSGEPAWAGLRHVTKTALAGLHHYVSLVLSELKAQGRIDDRDLQELMIALGGRGSSIFRQFVTDADTSDLAAVSKMIGMASAGLTAPDRVEPRFSEMPKEEVARGLLLEDPAAQAGDECIHYEPLGLTVTAVTADGPTNYGPTHDIRVISSNSDIQEVELQELHGFLENLGAATGLRIDLAGKKAEGIIQMRTRNHLKEQAARLPAAGDVDVDTQDVEAPFITALRNLVEVMCAPAQTRDAMLSVKERR